MNRLTLFMQRWLDLLISLNRWRTVLLLMLDGLLISFALWSAFALRLGDPLPPLKGKMWMFFAAPGITLLLLMWFGVYRSVVRFIGINFPIAVINSITLSALSLATITLLSKTQGVPRSAFIIYWLVANLLLSGSRYLIKAYYKMRFHAPYSKRRVAIYGAGKTGFQLATALSEGGSFFPVFFVDDDRNLHGKYIRDMVVFPSEQLKELIDELRITDILLAIPSLPKTKRQKILNDLETLPVHVRTVPTIEELFNDQKKVGEIRDIDVGDLLGRDTVPPMPKLMDPCNKNKTLLVTGAGGSIGSELCRHLIQLRPKMLVLFEFSEFSLYQIHRELEPIAKSKKVELISILGDIRDKARLKAVFDNFPINTVYHAAAYKHVPMVEHNMTEGVGNNIFGTLNTAQAALDAGVETFVLVSTDKAVRPTNVMGATKRFAELILQGIMETSNQTLFCIVRFGNVLNSSGSVVPLFSEQIARKGPVTVTHPDIIRYFMTIPEAAQLVIQAAAMCKGGDLFVLDMGEPVKVNDLAKKMIHISGFGNQGECNPNGDIEIKYIGLRPGEKLYEELLVGEDSTPTQHPKIMRAEEIKYSWEQMENFIQRLRSAVETHNFREIQEVLLESVHGFTTTPNPKDYLFTSASQEEEPAPLSNVTQLTVGKK